MEMARNIADLAFQSRRQTSGLPATQFRQPCICPAACQLFHMMFRLCVSDQDDRSDGIPPR